MSEKVSRHGIVGPMQRPGPAAPEGLSEPKKSAENIMTHFLFENRSLVDFQIRNDVFFIFREVGETGTVLFVPSLLW